MSETRIQAPTDLTEANMYSKLEKIGQDYARSVHWSICHYPRTTRSEVKRWDVTHYDRGGGDGPWKLFFECSDRIRCDSGLWLYPSSLGSLHPPVDRAVLVYLRLRLSNRLPPLKSVPHAFPCPHPLVFGTSRSPGVIFTQLSRRAHGLNSPKAVSRIRKAYQGRYDDYAAR